MSAQPSSSGPLALSSPFLVSEDLTCPPPVKIKQGPFMSVQDALDDSPLLSLREPLPVPDDIAPDAAIQIIRNLEQDIDELVTSYNGITFELEATRNALETERADRDAADSELEFPSSATVSNLTYERQLRDDLLESMKQLRAQNNMLADDLALQNDKCVALERELAAERADRQRLAVQLQHTSDKKRHSDGSLYALSVQNTLHLRDAVAITLQRHNLLEAQHVATLNQLAATRVALAEAEQQVSTLQRNMTTCVDASSTALAVERNLRLEMEARADRAKKENEELRVRERLMAEEVHELRFSSPSRAVAQSTPPAAESHPDRRLRQLVLRRLSTQMQPDYADASFGSPMFEHGTPSSCNTTMVVATPSPTTQRHSVSVYRDSPMLSDAVFKPHSAMKNIMNVERKGQSHGQKKRWSAQGKENRDPSRIIA
ncbi:hypothetical protein EV715DRAFT_292226 [Schizophyllum commune]